MPRLLLLACSVVLLDTLFFSTLAPLLPHYARLLELSKTELGILTASFGAGALCGAVPGGWLAAHWGVKPTVLGGLTIMVTMTAAFGFAGDILLLDVARFGQGVGSSLSWTGSMAWLVTVSPRERRGETIGIAISAAVIGALLGPVVGSMAVSFGPPLVFSAVALLGLVLLGCASAIAVERCRRRTSLQEFLRAPLSLRILAAVWLVSVPSLLLGNFNVLAPLRLTGIGFGHLGVTSVFVTAAAVETILNPLVGRWSDRRGGGRVLRRLLLLAAAASLLIPWIDRGFLLAPFMIVAAAIYGSVFVPGTLLLTEAVEDSGAPHGSGFALWNLAWAGGHMVGAAAAGWMADTVSDRLPFLFLGTLCVFTVGMVVRTAVPGSRADDRAPIGGSC